MSFSLYTDEQMTSEAVSPYQLDFNGTGKNEMLKPTEVIQVNLTNGNKNVTFKALFNQTGGAREFKDLWNQTLHETARDLT